MKELVVLSGKGGTGKTSLVACLAALATHFGIPLLVCVNKTDLNEEVAAAIGEWCRTRKIPVAGSVPYDRRFTEAQVQGRSLVELGDGATARAVREVWRRTRMVLERFP
jgi:MinD superfamily P-loop ATPase